MARTTIVVPDELLAQASALKVNVSDAARRGLRDAVESARVAAQLQRLTAETQARPIPVPRDEVARALRELREQGESA